MGHKIQHLPMRLLASYGAVLCILVVCVTHSDGAPLSTDVEVLGDAGDEDLGESMALSAEASDTEGVGEMAMYASTKKKLEGKIKTVYAGLKKKSAAAKKKFNAQMKKSSKIFAKLYAPIKTGPSPKLNSPLGDDGQAGISSMARWAYASSVSTWTKIAHKKVARYEKLLAENRYRHFSTAVCKEVLKSKVNAIGDMQYKKKKTDLKRGLKKQKVALKKKLAFDRADMEHKVASFKLWQENSKFAADGGVAGPDPKKTHMLTAGQAHKMGASRLGELTQAAHWAYARQKAHTFAVYSRNVKKLKKRLKKTQKQHDLTLCRTGRKPNSPQLKFELKRAKKKLKKELKKMPAKAQKKAAKKALKKKMAKNKKKIKKAKAKTKGAKKKGGKEEEYGDLGESGPDDDNEGTGTWNNMDETIQQFHTLVDSAGGEQSLSARAKMYQDLIAGEQVEQHNIAAEDAGLAA